MWVGALVPSGQGLTYQASSIQDISRTPRAEPERDNVWQRVSKTGGDYFTRKRLRKMLTSSPPDSTFLHFSAG
jgi:hypothetical protein